MIAPHRIKAYMLRHIYEIVATFDRKFDIIFWPTIDLLVFGLLTVYIQKLNVQANFAGAIIGGLILWTLVYSTQRDISISVLEDTWSRNLYNIFSTPITVTEVIISVFGLSVLKAAITIIFVTFLAWSLFGFNLFSVGPVIIFYLLNIFIFGWAFGCMTASMIFRFGLRVQIFAWSMIALLYPISGVFYPLSVLPPFLAKIAHLLPTSYIFEGLRTVILTGNLPSSPNFVIIIVLNLCYLTLGIWMFVLGFRSAKRRGWFIHPV